MKKTSQVKAYRKVLAVLEKQQLFEQIHNLAYSDGEVHVQSTDKTGAMISRIYSVKED